MARTTGLQDMASGLDRLAGARDAVAAAGLPPDALLIEPGDYSEASGEVPMRAAMLAGLTPDAVFAASDLMAMGALRVLRGAGLSVPGDVAVVGFDDSPVCRHTEPGPTSVHQPVEEMGLVRADLLLARLAGESPPAQTVLLTHHVERGST